MWAAAEGSMLDYASPNPENMFFCFENKNNNKNKKGPLGLRIGPRV